MPSIPITPKDEAKMLQTIGVQSIDDLFSTIPPQIRENADFKIDLGPGNEGRTDGLSEHELRSFMGRLAEKNAYSPKVTHFLGGGYYDNIIPAIVDQLVLRGEFLTCYTPYQPEISQGTLQAIFEFQTLMARMTAMEVSNASMYDGATAAAEAVLMAHRMGRGRRNFLVAGSLHPDTLAVVNMFSRQHADSGEPLPWNEKGRLDLDALKKRVADEDPFALLVGFTNYFGVLEDLAKIRAAVPESCLLIVHVADPSALSIFQPPGKLGADIVVGEAHQLGTPVQFGGPHVGFFATQKKYVRQMPGRLAGETVDKDGKRCYALTLATREQHIRREKSTSNICTNQGLIALRTTIYLSFLGKRGFQNLGETNYSLFDYLSRELEAVGISKVFSEGHEYREGLFKVPNLTHRFERAMAQGIVPGIPMVRKFPNNPDFQDVLLVCVNPRHHKSDLDQLVEVISHD